MCVCAVEFIFIYLKSGPYFILSGPLKFEHTDSVIDSAIKVTCREKYITKAGLIMMSVIGREKCAKGWKKKLE